MKRRLVAGGCSLGHFPAGSRGTAANVNSAPVGISLLERWTESLTVNRMRALIDALGAMTKAWSRGNTFGVECRLVEAGDGLLGDAVAAGCCGRARHRSFVRVPAPKGSVRSKPLVSDQAVGMVRDADFEGLAPRPHSLQR